MRCSYVYIFLLRYHDNPCVVNDTGIIYLLRDSKEVKEIAVIVAHRCRGSDYWKGYATCIKTNFINWV